MRILLASRSPRRRELLEQIVPASAIEVRPPRDEREPGFEGLETWDAIERQLRQITRAKFDDVALQIGSEFPELIVAADTIIAVPRGEAAWTVLGKPPDPGGRSQPLQGRGRDASAGHETDYESTVRVWMTELLAGRTHLAATGLILATSERVIERVVTTRVTFRPDVAEWVDWYLSTGEPRGKAGAYAIQGAGSVLVSHIEGSLSNVVGLPLEAVLDMLRELGLSVPSP